MWRKAVRGSVHMLRVPKAWCFDFGDLTRAEAAGARLVLVHDLEGFREHWATITTIRARGFELDRKHGRQVGLGIEWWRPSRAEAVAAVVHEREPYAPGVSQLSMFAEGRR